MKVKIIEPIKLKKIVDFINSQEVDSIHFLKKRYTVLIDFQENKIVYKRGIDYHIPINIANNRKSFLKEHKDQSLYNENIFYLKKYLEFRGSIHEFKRIIFSQDFTSIRIEQ